MPVRPTLRILYCRCSSAAVLPAETQLKVQQGLAESGLPHDAVADLCALAARHSPLLSELASASRLTVLACHPRAVKWLFAAGGAPLRDEGVEFLDLRKAPAAQALGAIRDLAAEAAGGAGAAAAEFHGETAAAAEWKPWFPVIDYERCENCQQCLGFCLFGVYGLSADGKVQVQNPASCKTGCPACARVCPSAAIIFPKYAHAPINGGEVSPNAPLSEPVQIDKAALLSGDVMKILQERGKGGLRFAAQPEQVRAVQERLVHLAGISRRPDFALDALPAQPAEKSEQA